MKEEGKNRWYLWGCDNVSDFLNGVSGIVYLLLLLIFFFLKFITSGYDIMCISA